MYLAYGKGSMTGRYIFSPLTFLSHSKEALEETEREKRNNLQMGVNKQFYNFWETCSGQQLGTESLHLRRLANPEGQDLNAVKTSILSDTDFP